MLYSPEVRNPAHGSCLRFVRCDCFNRVILEKNLSLNIVDAHDRCVCMCVGNIYIYTHVCIEKNTYACIGSIYTYIALYIYICICIFLFFNKNTLL